MKNLRKARARELAQRLQNGEISRRDFVQRGVVLGAGFTSMGAILAACGDDSPAPAAAPATTAAPTTAAPTTAAPAPDRKIIGLSDPFGSSPVVIQEAKFAEARAAEVGYTLLRDAGQNDLAAQVATIETWIAEDIPAICCFPFEASALEPLAKEAVDKGIVWVSLVSHMQSETAAILFQNEQSGMQLGNHAADWINANLGGEAKLAYLNFDAVQAGRDRKDTWAAIIEEKCPNAEVVSDQEAYDPPGGLAVIETVLQQHPDLNVVLGINDGGVLGAWQAFKNAEGSYNPDEVYLGAMDGPLEALNAVAECGIYRATAAFSVREVGEAFIDVPRSILEGAAPQDFPVPTVLLECGHPRLDEFLSDWAT